MLKMRIQTQIAWQRNAVFNVPRDTGRSIGYSLRQPGYYSSDQAGIKK
jgi:hypothetical protein